MAELVIVVEIFLPAKNMLQQIGRNLVDHAVVGPLVVFEIPLRLQFSVAVDAEFLRSVIDRNPTMAALDGFIPADPVVVNDRQPQTQEEAEEKDREPGREL